jgi:hypothetical protein
LENRLLSKEWGETPERIGHGSATPAPAIEDWKGDEVTQDALYAMRYDPDGLAQGAFDARLERYGSKQRNISISFRQPPILKDGEPIAYYRISDPSTGGLSGQEIITLKADNYSGQEVIEAIIANDNKKLNEEKKYDLEARTHVDNNTRSAPSVFTVIVKPGNP